MPNAMQVLSPIYGIISGVQGATKKKSSQQSQQVAQPPVYKRGGKVKKTGMAKVHRGERVLTKKQQRKRGGSRR